LGVGDSELARARRARRRQERNADG
jgi:hypothetical protein